VGRPKEAKLTAVIFWVADGQAKFMEVPSGKGPAQTKESVRRVEGGRGKKTKYSPVLEVEGAAHTA
jgi:hypothetical protein